MLRSRLKVLIADLTFCLVGRERFKNILIANKERRKTKLLTLTIQKVESYKAIQIRMVCSYVTYVLKELSRQ